MYIKEVLKIREICKYTLDVLKNCEISKYTHTL